MNLTWWEWEELKDAIEARPDMWAPHSSQALTYIRSLGEHAMYALQAMPAPGTGTFRMVQLRTVPLDWSKENVASHLSYMVQKFTSYPFRSEVERFLISELGIDAKKAYSAAIIIGRMEQGPVLDPTPEKIYFPPTGRTFFLHEGGTLVFRDQGEQLRVHIELKSRLIGGWSFILLDGFVRPRGKSTRQAIEWLLTDGSEASRKDTYASDQVEFEDERPGAPRLEPRLPFGGPAPALDRNEEGGSTRLEADPGAGTAGPDIPEEGDTE